LRMLGYNRFFQHFAVKSLAIAAPHL